jgi:hypothetical protein
MVLSINKEIATGYAIMVNITRRRRVLNFQLLGRLIRPQGDARGAFVAQSLLATFLSRRVERIRDRSVSK